MMKRGKDHKKKLSICYEIELPSHSEIFMKTEFLSLQDHITNNDKVFEQNHSL